MNRDDERMERIRQNLTENGLDAVACALPSNVLLLTGYYPIVGTAIAIAAKDGQIVIVAPNNEKTLALSF